MRQHTSAYAAYVSVCQHTCRSAGRPRPACVSIRQHTRHTSAYVSIHAVALVGLDLHTSAYVSIRGIRKRSAGRPRPRSSCQSRRYTSLPSAVASIREHASAYAAYVSIPRSSCRSRGRRAYVSIRQHTSAYVSIRCIRQHTLHTLHT
jgi:hypothetical protein